MVGYNEDSEYSEESFFEDLSNITPPDSTSSVDEIKRKKQRQKEYQKMYEKESTIQSPKRGDREEDQSTIVSGVSKRQNEEDPYGSDTFDSDGEEGSLRQSPKIGSTRGKVEIPKVGDTLNYGDPIAITSKPDSSYGEKRTNKGNSLSLESQQNRNTSYSSMGDSSVGENSTTKDDEQSQTSDKNIDFENLKHDFTNTYEDQTRIIESDEVIQRRELESMQAAEYQQRGYPNGKDKFWGIDAAQKQLKENLQLMYIEDMRSRHVRAEDSLINAFDIWMQHDNQQRKIDKANQTQIEKIRRDSYLSNFYAAEWSDSIFEYRWPPKGGAECQGVGAVNSMIDTTSGPWDIISTAGGTCDMVNTARGGSSSMVSSHYLRTAATTSTIFNELKPEYEEIFNNFEREYQGNRKLESRYKLVDINRLQINSDSREGTPLLMPPKSNGRQSSAKDRLKESIRSHQRKIETATINDNFYDATNNNVRKKKNNNKAETVPIHDGVQSIFHFDRKKRHIIPENVIRNTAAQRAAIQAAANSSDFDHEVKSRKRKAQKIVNRTKERLDKFLATDEQSMMIALFQAIDTKRVGFIGEAEALRAIKYDEYVREIMQKTTLWTIYKRGEIKQLLDLIFHPERVQGKGKSEYSIGRQVDFRTFYSCLQDIQKEENVLYKNIRPYRSSSLSAAGNDGFDGFSPLATVLLDNILPYEEGTRVEFLYKGGPLWQPGRILKHNADNTYTIKTDIFQQDRVLNLGLIHNKSTETEGGVDKQNKPVSGAGNDISGDDIGIKRKHRHEMDVIEDFFDVLWLEESEQQEKGINVVSFKKINKALRQNKNALLVTKSKILSAIRDMNAFELTLSKLSRETTSGKSSLSKTEFRTYCDIVADILQLNKNHMPKSTE